MEGFFDTEYFIEDYVNRKPHWRGLGKSHIFFLPKTKVWRLESFYATEKYADLPADDTDPYAYYPLGRLKWRIFDGICQMSEGGLWMTRELSDLILGRSSIERKDSFRYCEAQVQSPKVNTKRTFADTKITWATTTWLPAYQHTVACTVPPKTFNKHEGVLQQKRANSKSVSE